MLQQAVYISSDDRSGSTLLDLLLGNHSKVTSIGEVHNLPAYVFQKRTFYDPIHELICMCGVPFSKCNFWNEVEEELPFPLAHLRLRKEKITSNLIIGKLNEINCKIIDNFLNYNPTLLGNFLFKKLSGYKKIAEHNFHLYEAIAKVSGKPTVVDSSKWPFRFKYLFDYNPQKIKIIMLFRDPHAVVYSKIKRGEGTIESTTLDWVKIARQMESYGKNIPDDKKILVKYEDICTDTTNTMKKISEFLNIKFEKNLCLLNKENHHHVGGSPSKFDKKKTLIRLDKSYQDNLSKTQQRTINELVSRSGINLDFFSSYLETK